MHVVYTCQKLASRQRVNWIVNFWDETGAGRFEWTVMVPPNTTATARVPQTDGQRVTLNGASVNGPEHELPAGEHTFVVT